jgi:hypothetical protein
MTTNVPRVVLVAAAVLLALLALVLWMRDARRTPAVVADPVRTPGMLTPSVTQATIASTICVRGWTRTVRPPTDYTNALKVRQMRLYRERGPLSGYQEDHLISLELGGDPTDPRNLWPEPYPRAAAVDQIENDLNAQVCSGALSLADAQRKEAELKHTQG